MRKIFLAGIGIATVVAGFFGGGKVSAGGPPTEEQIVVFVRDGCEHCEAELAWLRESGLDFNALWVDGKNGGPAPVEVARSIVEPLFIEATTRENLARVTPLTFVGGEFLVGFDRGETTGAAIRAAAEGAEPGWSFDKYWLSGRAAGTIGEPGTTAPAPFVDGAAPADELPGMDFAPIVVFERENCTHCEDLKAWVKGNPLAPRVDFLDIESEPGRTLFAEVQKRENLAAATPVTFLKGQFFVGFDRAETTGKFFESLLKRRDIRPNFAEYLASGKAAGLHGAGAAACPEDSPDEICATPTQKIRVPWTDWTVDPSEFSLPMTAAVLGFIDGFNPCAMWVLVTFLIILAELGDRRKMALAAGLFLVAEAAMYFAILNGWSFALAAVNAISSFAGPAVGVVAVAAGGFFLWEAATVPAGECKVVNPTRRVKISAQIRAVLARPLGIATALGIIGIALSVNVIEFVCSVGIPQTYAQILEINAVGPVFRQVLNGIYTALYMADDVVVFTIAVVSFGALAATTGKYAKIAQWLGGGLMVVLGGLLIFAPGVLRF